MLVGKRNLIIALCSLVVAAYYGHLAGEDVVHLGPTLLSLGTMTAAIIGTRAAHRLATAKLVEAKNGHGE